MFSHNRAMQELTKMYMARRITAQAFHLQSRMLFWAEA